MNFQDYPHYFVYLLVIYLFMLAYGANFLLTAAQYGILAGGEAVVLSLAILLPCVFLFLCALRSKALFLYRHRNILRYAAAVSMAVSSGFILMFILPLGF